MSTDTIQETNNKVADLSNEQIISSDNSQQKDIPLDDLISMMDSMVDNTYDEIKVTGDNIEEVKKELSENIKDEGNKIDSDNTETETLEQDESDEDSNIEESVEDDDQSETETGEEEISEEDVTGHDNLTEDIDESPDNVESEEEKTNLSDGHYEKLLKSLSDVAGVEIEELTPEMLAEMYRSAKGLTSNTSTTVEQVMIDKYNIKSDDLALLSELKSGNVDAIKKLLIENKINPFEIDLEEFNKDEFDNKLQEKTVNPVELKLNNFIQVADKQGVKEVVVDKVLNWDESSILELLDDPETTSTLMQQIKNGSFDEVMAEVRRLEALDFNNNNKKSMLDKYSEASYSLLNKKRAEAMKKAQENKVVDSRTTTVNIEKNNTVKQKKSIKQNKQTKSTKRNKVVDNEARKEAAKAASQVSSDITVTQPSKQDGNTLDINRMSDEELYKFMDNMINV